MNTPTIRRRVSTATCALAVAPMAVLIAFLGAGTASAESQPDAIATAQQAYNDAVSKRDAATKQVDEDRQDAQQDLLQIEKLGGELEVWMRQAIDLQKRADALTRDFDVSREMCAHGLDPFACVLHENQEADVQRAQADALHAARMRNGLETKIAGLRRDLNGARSREQTDQRQVDAANAAVASAKARLECVTDFSCWKRQSSSGPAAALPHSGLPQGPMPQK